MSFVHTFSDGDSDSTVDLSLSPAPHSEVRQKLIHSRSVHEISDSDSDITIDTSAVANIKHNFPTKKEQLSKNTHDSSTSECDIIPDTDSEGKNLVKIPARKVQIAHRKRNQEHDISSTDSENESDSRPFKRSKNISICSDLSKSPRVHCKPQTSNSQCNDSNKKKKKAVSIFDISTDELSSSEEIVKPKSPHMHCKSETSNLQCNNKNKKMKKAVSIFDVSTDELSSSEEVVKPKCPHGLKCYRKNPSHFEEYKHPDKHPGKNYYF